MAEKSKKLAGRRIELTRQRCVGSSRSFSEGENKQTKALWAGKEDFQCIPEGNKLARKVSIVPDEAGEVEEGDTFQLLIDNANQLYICAKNIPKLVKQ